MKVVKSVYGSEVEVIGMQTQLALGIKMEGRHAVSVLLDPEVALELAKALTESAKQALKWRGR